MFPYTMSWLVLGYKQRRNVDQLSYLIMAEQVLQSYSMCHFHQLTPKREHKKKSAPAETRLYHLLFLFQFTCDDDRQSHLSSELYQHTSFRIVSRQCSCYATQERLVHERDSDPKGCRNGEDQTCQDSRS